MQQTRGEWQIVFFISSGIYIFGGVIYMIFATGRLQRWALESEDVNQEGVELKRHSIDGRVTNGSISQFDDVADKEKC